ncbi:hypothetical protein KPK_4179 [Klebsiella variicola]|uniref:Uncharacterized protein n=6 Tax=Klebsiella TaxID=570 RepID=B5Y0I9_KLEV3|nr:hypothetical protein KPK_4179 [Klebsiella variicola]
MVWFSGLAWLSKLCISRGCSMANSIPNSGRAVMMRNAKTGATWKVSRDYLKETFWFEPQGNLRHIRKAFEARDLLPNLVPAGTH